MTEWTTAWRRRTWRAHPELLAAGAAGGGSRAVLRCGSLVGADLGVPWPWGVQLTAGDRVPPATEAADGLAWCAARGRLTGWRVSVPADLVGAGPWSDLVARDATAVFALDGRAAARLSLHIPEGVTLDRAPTRDDVVDGYGGWMADPELAALLVTPADLQRPGRRFVVARLDGVIAGCAFVWWAAGTGYLSGLGVLPELRGRGIGRTLTAAAARVAATDCPTGTPDVVWMHATDDGAPLYARLGFHRIDTEVLLGPA